MSPKKRGVQFKTRKIPRSARWKAKFRKWASSLWRDIRGKNKTKDKSGRQESFQFCPMCERTRPLWVADFGQCDEHPESCGCCIYGMHGAPPQGMPRQRMKPPASKFKPGDPARQGYKTEKEQHAEQQAAYQAEIVEQARQETESTETADSGEEGGGEQ